MASQGLPRGPRFLPARRPASPRKRATTPTCTWSATATSPIEIWTHAVGGLTENDFILAAKIDKLPVELKKCKVHQRCSGAPEAAELR